MKTSDCKCVECGSQAVAFWPVLDPDIPDHPYCRKCLNKAKIEALMNIMGWSEKYAKAYVKIEEEFRIRKSTDNG